eukprot:1709726-Ditylum_brightwellii.AAC.2
MAYCNALKRTCINVKKKQLMLIWSFRRKQHAGRSLTKYKVTLRCHSGQQQWGVNYYVTHAPVVLWPA